MQIGIFLTSFSTKQAGSMEEFVLVSGAYEGVLKEKGNDKEQIHFIETRINSKCK